MTTLHSNSPTTDLPVSNSTIESNSSEDTPSIPPRFSSSVVLRNISQYERNESIPMPPIFSRRLDVLPLDVPPNENATEWLNNTNKDLPVINQTETSLNGNFTGFLSNRNKSMNCSSNHIEDVTSPDDLSFNPSIVQQSERLGIEESSIVEETTGNLSAAGITGITLGCIVVVGIICGVTFFLYRNQGFNRPQVLNDRCSNPDSSGYIDDASDNSEEMYSLDNDSFLNSLEAMTIQNYWTDTVKHTKL